MVLALLVISGFMFLLDRQRNLDFKYVPEPSPDFFLLNAYDEAELVQSPIISGETAVFIGNRTPDELTALTAIDIRTGQLKWLVDVNDVSEPDWWFEELEWNYPLQWQWGPIATDGGAVFQADRFLISTTVTAFELETGEPLWEREIGTINGSPVRQLNMIDGLLAVRIIEPSYSDLYVVDPSNGFRVFRENESASSLFWREEIEGYDRDYRAYNFGMEATTVNPWQFQFESCGLTPQVQPDRIVVHALMCDESGRGAIFALDRHSGATLWRLDVPVVSQISIDGEFGFVLSQDNQLLALDLASGNILSILRFDKPIRNFSPETPIYVGSGGGKTAVYISMSNQLLFFDSIFKNNDENIDSIEQ